MDIYNVFMDSFSGKMFRGLRKLLALKHRKQRKPKTNKNFRRHIIMNNEEKILNLLENMQSDISGMQSDISGMKSDITDLKKGQSELANRLGGVDKRLGGIDKRLDGIDEKLEVIEEDVAIARHASNLVLEWADKADVGLNIGLYDK